MSEWQQVRVENDQDMKKRKAKDILHRA